jgi:glycopeptide antibiotics resistance protein
LAFGSATPSTDTSEPVPCRRSDGDPLAHPHEARDAFSHGDPSAALDVTLVASILSVLILTLPPSIDAPRTLNLMPFEELRHAVGNFGISQLVGNALMFVPLGFLTPLRWPRIDSPIGIFVAAAASSIAIEVLQFVLPTGRQSSVTDVVMNTTGALAGYALMVTIRGSMKLSRRHPGNREPVSP